MINFTPKEKPSNRVTDVEQLESGQTYLVDGDPCVYLEQDGDAYFLDLRDSCRTHASYSVRKTTVIQADFELTEL